MDKAPKTTPKSQLLVFSPDVLKKLGITAQLAKLTTTTVETTPDIPKKSDEIKLKTNINNRDNKLQLELALNSSNANQIKPNEGNSDKLLLNVETDVNKSNELSNKVNVVELPGKAENKQIEKSPININKLEENVEILPKSSNEILNNESLISINVETKKSNETELIDEKFQLDLNTLDPRVAEILTPSKRGRPKGKTKRASQSFLATNVTETPEKTTPKVEDETPQRRRSGRPRKEKKFEDAVYYADTPEKTKKRGRPARNINKTIVDTSIIETTNLIGCPENIIAPASANESEADDELNISKTRRGRRRTRKNINRIESDDEYEIKVDEKKITKKAKKSLNSKLIECGVCNEKMVNSLWAYHCGKHNYLCWRVGEDPIDLEDRRVCESVLLKVVATKKVTFTCAKCGERRKSVVGYLSHLDICQKTEEERLAMRVMCPECHKLMQPCSLKIHMRNHLNESSKISVNSIIETVESEAGSTGGRVKRNAAKKAQGLINQFTNENDDADGSQTFEKDITRLYKRGSDQKKIFSQRRYVKQFRNKFKKSGSMACPINKCTYTAFDFKEAKDHIETCPQLSPNDFICFACFLITQDQQLIEKHILETHLSNEAQQLDEDDDADALSSQTDGEDDEDEIEEDEDEDEDVDDGDYDDETEDTKSKKQKQKRKTPISENGTNTSASLANKEKNQNQKNKGCFYLGSCTDKIKFLANEVRISASRNCTYPAAGKWSLEFYKNNNSTENLFMDFFLENYWQQVSDVDHDKYLPPTKKSISVKTILASKTLPDLQGQEHNDWKEFQLFEAELNHNDDTVTIFCGGPVWEVAWLPTPLNSTVDQILAVCIQRDFNETYKTSRSYASHEIIQFWNFGELHFKSALTTNAPKLELIVVHGHGNVWCMEWCPSGCYDDELDADSSVRNRSFRRMGLLALACSDGAIPIYAIYFPQNDNNDKYKMFKPIESCLLIMQDNNETNKLGNWNYQCTKLKWSKIKGHNIITAGYSNGMVCLWDLNNTSSPLLRSADKNGTAILRPYFCFQPHTAAITALHYYYPLTTTGDSIRWLFTGSWDRNSYLWDLQDPSTPIFVFNKRGNVSDGALINHWLCSIVSYDDVHFLEHTTTSIQNIRDFGFKNSSLLSANSMVMGLSASDWANAIAQVTLAGELCCTFQRQLLVGYDVDKGTKLKRFLLSYSETIDRHLDSNKRKKKQDQKNKQKQTAATTNIPEKYDKNFFRYLVSKENEPFDDEDEPDTYEQVSNKYGVIFCDIPLDNPEKIPPETLKMVKTSSNMKDAPTEMYPILAQNCVAWNPNKQAYIYICSGYHSGFVRLRCVRFMHSKLLTLIK